MQTPSQGSSNQQRSSATLGDESSRRFNPLDESDSSDSGESITELITRKRAERAAAARGDARDGGRRMAPRRGSGAQFANVNRRLFRASDLVPSSPPDQRPQQTVPASEPAE